MIDQIKQLTANIKDQINIFENLIKKNHKDAQTLGFLRKKATQSFIIDLYTLWETSIKELIFNSLKNNTSLFIDDGFISNYAKEAMDGNKHIKRKFLESFSSNKLFITKDILCSSNNLDYDSLNKILLRLVSSIKKTDFELFCNSQNYIKKSIQQLKDSGIEKEGSLTDLPGYIKTLVNDRNNLSHNHDISLFYNQTQRIHLTEFIECMVIAVNKFIENQIAKKIISDGLGKELDIHKIHKGNSATQPAILELRFSDYTYDVKSERMYFLKYEHNNNFFFDKVLIDEIKNEKGNRCRKFPKNGNRSIAVILDKKIDSNKTYTFFEIESEKIPKHTHGIEIIIMSS